MLVIPSVPLRAGLVVRSTSHGSATVGPTTDPIETARAWSSLGFQRLELADLDEGEALPRITALIEEIARDGSLEVQAAGDFDRTERIERLFEAGTSSVVLGARALDDRDWLEDTVELFPHALIVAAGADDRTVITRGWRRSVRANLLDLAGEVAALPIAGLLVRAANGAEWSGAELGLFEEIVETSGVPLLVESPSATLETIRALENRGVSAVVMPEAAIGAMVDPRRLVYEFSG